MIIWSENAHFRCIFSKMLKIIQHFLENEEVKENPENKL